MGPAHYTMFKRRFDGKTKLRLKILEKKGYKVLSINYKEWDKFTSLEE